MIKNNYFYNKIKFIKLNNFPIKSNIDLSDSNIIIFYNFIKKNLFNKIYNK